MHVRINTLIDENSHCFLGPIHREKFRELLHELFLNKLEVEFKQSGKSPPTNNNKKKDIIQ